MKRLKATLLRLLYRVDLALPRAIGVWLRNRALPSARPVLDYVECHLTDHCNMNCTGCTHFSPFVAPKFTDPSVMRRDFLRLAELFSNIRHLRLMGGEPLMHPQVAEFVRMAREIFPRSRITLVTNGILLDKMPKDFWEACRDSRVNLDISVYPNMAERQQRWRDLCSAAGVGCRDSEKVNFSMRLVKEGGVDPKAAFKFCRSYLYCPFLYEGRLYTCAQCCFVWAYNKVSGSDIPVDEGIDLFADGQTGYKVMRRLMEPVGMCAYCATSERGAAWRNDDHSAEAWLR